MLPTPAPVPPIPPSSHPTLAIAAALVVNAENTAETAPGSSTPATIAAAAHDAPSHVLALIILGLVLWALNLALLPRSGVPVGRILRLASPPVPPSTDDIDVELKPPKQAGVEPEVGVVVSTAAVDAAAARSTMWGTLAVACWLGVVVAAAHAFEYVDTYPAVLYAMVLGIVVCPLDVAGMRERYTFLRALGRLFSPNLALPVSLADVILADILTSFARVFGDWYTSLGPNMPWPDLVVPFLVSVPYLVRFKQCLAELLREHYKPVPSSTVDEITTDDHASDSDTDAGIDDTAPPLPQYRRRNSHPTPPVRTAYLPLPPTPWHRHLANMVKYFSALPVIYLAALRHHEQHRASLATIAIDTSPTLITESATSHPPPTTTATTTALLTTAWIASLLVNSLLSFYWDVFLDWSLGRRPVHTRFPTLTRARRQTRTVIYYTAMVVDFILRFLWALRLSALVVPSAAAMSAAEVARRGMWCFLRIESEWCSNVEKRRGSGTRAEFGREVGSAGGGAHWRMARPWAPDALVPRVYSAVEEGESPVGSVEELGRGDREKRRD
ncbi:protein-ER retention protein [Allomyces javanicus]|nr:protein-ER retention protein [Allomyces javanicus]